MTDDVVAVNKGFGWIRDTPDIRDFKFVDRVAAPVAVPPAVDLSPYLGLVFDQGQLGSCTANAIAGAVMALQNRQFGQCWTPSRLFIYYGERVLEGTVQSDAGAMIRDGFKVIAKGFCHEELWPYNVAKFKQKPSAKAYTDAKKHLAIRYESVATDLNQMKAALAGGFPIVVGFSVYQSFVTQQVAQTGVVPMPDPREQQLGGHATLVYGYDDRDGYFRVRNSWGQGWGRQGNYLMPYPYLTNPQLAGDFWICEQEQG